MVVIEALPPIPLLAKRRMWGSSVKAVTWKVARVAAHRSWSRRRTPGRRHLALGWHHCFRDNRGSYQVADSGDRRGSPIADPARKEPTAWPHQRQAAVHVMSTIVPRPDRRRENRGADLDTLATTCRREAALRTCPPDIRWGGAQGGRFDLATHQTAVTPELPSRWRPRRQWRRRCF
jgi:hypothetical protein